MDIHDSYKYGTLLHMNTSVATLIQQFITYYCMKYKVLLH